MPFRFGRQAAQTSCCQEGEMSHAFPPANAASPYISNTRHELLFPKYCADLVQE
jgi:hypothetical protein